MKIIRANKEVRRGIPPLLQTIEVLIKALDLRFVY